MSKIVAEAWVPVPIAKVFSFFSDPENLPHLMPSQLRAKIEDISLAPLTGPLVVESGQNSAPIAGPGSLITISFRAIPFLPFRTSWIAQIVELVPGSHFRDIQQRGPMKFWSHTHQFTSEPRGGVTGTLVRDIVQYELPFGLLGSIANLLFVRTFMKLTFRSRQKNLAILLH